jgi:hypothetical protein
VRRFLVLASVAVLGTLTWLSADARRGGSASVFNEPHATSVAASRASASQTTSASQSLATVAPSATEEALANPPLPPVTITGIVLQPNRTPAPYALIEVRSSTARFQVSAGPDGRFEIPCRDSEPCDISVREGGSEPHSATLARVTPPARDLVLQLRPPALAQLTVTNASGAFVERYALALLSERTRHSLTFLALAEHAEGWCEFKPPVEDYLLEVRAPGLRPERIGPLRAHSAPRLAVTLSLAEPEEAEPSPPESAVDGS